MTTQRYPLYRPIHKAMRHSLFDTSQKVGLADFADDADVEEAMTAVDQMISLLHHHRDNEDKFIHPPAESRIPGITAKFDDDHNEDIALSKEVQGIVGQIRGASGAERAALGIKLHERLNAYVGIYLGHLYREETELQQALWDNFTDEELLGIEIQIVSSVEPPVMAQFIQVMCSSYSPAEITPILGNIKANAPAEFFDFAMSAAEQGLPPRSWEKVKAGLG